MAWYSPIPSHPGTPLEPVGASVSVSGRVMGILRVGLPLLLVLLLAAAIYPAAASSKPSGRLTD